MRRASGGEGIRVECAVLNFSQGALQIVSSGWGHGGITVTAAIKIAFKMTE